MLRPVFVWLLASAVTTAFYGGGLALVSAFVPLTTPVVLVAALIFGLVGNGLVVQLQERDRRKINDARRKYWGVPPAAHVCNLGQKVVAKMENTDEQRN